MNTSGYGGRKLNKSITLKTDDPKHPVLPLSIGGMVEKFATISPRVVKLRGNSTDEIISTVTIIIEDRYPFSITETKAKDGKNIHVKLEELKEKGKKGYILTVKNIKKDEGRYRDIVVLKTTSKIRPEITVGVYGQIQAPQIATISPKTVRLAGDIGQTIEANVTIIPKKETLFSITEAKAKDGKNICIKLEELKEEGKKGYILIVKNIKKDKGRYRDTVVLKTTSKIRPEIVIGVYGRIKAPQIATISPRRVSLRGKVGEPLKAIVTIEPMEKYPFEILGIKADTGKHIRFDLKKLEESKKTKYVLTIENQKKEKGSYRDTIRLKTSSKIQSEIQIGIFARIVDPQDMQGASGNRSNDFKKFFQQLQKRKDGKKKSQDSSNAEPPKGIFTDHLKKQANQ